MGFDHEAGSSSYSLPVSETSSSPLLLPQHQQKLSSQLKTFANVFIAIVGAGVLGLPYTFMRTGWAAGSLMLLAVGALTTHCMLLLVAVRRRLDSDKISSFGDLAFAASGPVGIFAVDAMIVLSQSGFCVSYLIFVATTLTRLSRHSKPLFVAILLPFQLALNSIPSLTHLASLSILADVVDLGAMGVVLVEDALVILRSPPTVAAFGPASLVLYGFGVAVYAFEGIGMVIPLESEAADKSKFGRTLSLSMAAISIMYVLFGVMGYLAFGEDTKEIITANFGGGMLSMVVQLGLCVNLFFTFPIMMNPVFEVAERRMCGKKYCWWARWALVAAVAAVAVVVPNFADFLSLVGSSVCCVLGFVLPAAFHLMVFGGDLGWSSAASDVAIVVVGIVFAVSGTWSSLNEIFFSVKV